MLNDFEKIRDNFFAVNQQNPDFSLPEMIAHFLEGENINVKLSTIIMILSANTVDCHRRVESLQEKLMSLIDLVQNMTVILEKVSNIITPEDENGENVQ